MSCLPEDIQLVSAHSAFALPKIARFYLLREGLTGQARDTSSARVACRAGSAQLDTNWKFSRTSCECTRHNSL